MKIDFGDKKFDGAYDCYQFYALIAVVYKKRIYWFWTYSISGVEHHASSNITRLIATGGSIQAPAETNLKLNMKNFPILNKLIRKELA
jgi:hypothetical protein